MNDDLIHLINWYYHDSNKYISSSSFVILQTAKRQIVFVDISPEEKL